MSKIASSKRTRTVVKDSNDELQIKKAMDGEKDRERDLAWIMGQPRGRRWIYETLFVTCHVNHLSHVPRDTHSTAFNEGARSVGQKVLEELRTKHHALYIKMLEENDERSDD